MGTIGVVIIGFLEVCGCGRGGWGELVWYYREEKGDRRCFDG